MLEIIFRCYPVPGQSLGACQNQIAFIVSLSVGEFSAWEREDFENLFLRTNPGFRGIGWFITFMFECVFDLVGFGFTDRSCCSGYETFVLGSCQVQKPSIGPLRQGRRSTSQRSDLANRGSFWLGFHRELAERIHTDP